ncbi:MAG: dockerin type I repeat-containing protein [bacterium]|nr:dockerin type I repeat-containing protein [bacterium]
MKKSLLTLFFLSFFISNASSQVYLEENFNYTAGDSIGAHGWTGFSSSLNIIKVSTPGLSYTGYPTSGIGNAVFIDSTGEDSYRNMIRNLDSNNTNSVYLSFMVNVSSAKTYGDYFIALLPSGSTSHFTARFHAKDSLGNLRFGVTKTSQSDSTINNYSPNNYSYNTTYLIIVKYNIVSGSSNDKISFFVLTSGIPSAEPAPTFGPVAFSSSDAGNAGRIALRQGSSGTGPKVKVDGIRVSKSWYSIANSMDTVEIANVYKLGRNATPFGYRDTIVVQYIQYQPNPKPKKIVFELHNDSIDGTLKNYDEKIFGTNPLDTNVKFIIDDAGKEKTDFVVVKVIGEDNTIVADDQTNNQDTTCYYVNYNTFNQANPCISSNVPLGLGRSSNLLSSFRNRSNLTYGLNQVDHCILSSTNAGSRPYRIIVYDDNGSGKPGSQLHASPIMYPPNGANIPTRVLYNLSIPISIAAGKKFYIGYRQLASLNFNACTQTETPVRPKTFFFSYPDTSNNWYDFRDSSYNNILDIAAVGNSYLKLTVFQEGFYDSGPNSKVADTNRVYLRNTSSPYSVVDSAKSFDSTNGITKCFFSKAINGVPYYIQIKHRNSIETWSATGQSFTSAILNYNLSTASSQAFGSNMAQVDASPVRYAIFSGDVNQDGTIDVSDIVYVYNEATNFVSGYVVSDVTGDNFVDASDLVITYNNAVNFVAVISP